MENVNGQKTLKLVSWRDHFKPHQNFGKSGKNLAHSIFFKILTFLKKILWAEFLPDFQNVGIKIFRKAISLKKIYTEKKNGHKE